MSKISAHPQKNASLGGAAHRGQKELHTKNHKIYDMSSIVSLRAKLFGYARTPRTPARARKKKGGSREKKSAFRARKKKDFARKKKAHFARKKRRFAREKKGFRAKKKALRAKKDAFRAKKRGKKALRAKKLAPWHLVPVAVLVNSVTIVGVQLTVSCAFSMPP